MADSKFKVMVALHTMVFLLSAFTQFSSSSTVQRPGSTSTTSPQSNATFEIPRVSNEADDAVEDSMNITHMSEGIDAAAENSTDTADEDTAEPEPEVEQNTEPENTPTGEAGNPEAETGVNIEEPEQETNPEGESHPEPEGNANPEGGAPEGGSHPEGGYPENHNPDEAPLNDEEEESSTQVSITTELPVKGPRSGLPFHHIILISAVAGTSLILSITVVLVILLRRQKTSAGFVLKSRHGYDFSKSELNKPSYTKSNIYTV